MFPTDLPIMQYLDLNGDPLNGGYIYFGEPDQNPETNPVAVYWDLAGGQPATQPVRTTNGYTVRRGIISPVYLNQDFSITIRDKKNRLVYTAPRASNAGSIPALFSLSTGSSMIGFIQAGTGAVARTLQGKGRDILDLRDFGVIAGSGNDYTSEVQAAFDEASSQNIACYCPSGNIIITNTITPSCSIIGQGSPQDATGTIFVWQGSAASVFEFGAYKQGWNFNDFRIDMSGVTSDTTAMYFNDGLTWGSFSNLCFKGRHTGPSWGGTYFNHDGITIEGGANMSECTFRRIVFFRNRNGLTVTDPHARGDGNNSIIESCYAFVDGWAVKMCGPNNTITMFESNVEAGNHSFVQDGQFAANWVYLGCNFSTGASGAGNQIIYANTSGGSNIATILGGSLEEANTGGFAGLVRDAGATGGKVFRYMAQGVNNFNATAITIDQLDVGQSSARANQFFYVEGTFTPTWTGLTVTGSPTYSGKYTLIGNVLHWTVRIIPDGGGSTTASTAGTTRINNMPFNQTGTAVNCIAANAGTLESYGVGQGATGGKNMFTPTWAAAAEGIIISGSCFTDGST